MILGILVLVFTPLWLLVKVAGFDFGICFFALWPIASNYPQFRLLTSISKRVFWNIPTNGEFACCWLGLEWMLTICSRMGHPIYAGRRVAPIS